MGGLTYKGHPPPPRSGQLELGGRRARHPALISKAGDRDSDGARVFPKTHPDEAGELTLPITPVPHPVPVHRDTNTGPVAALGPKRAFSA